MAISFRPLKDRLLVRQREAAEVTEGGIVLPENSREAPLEGRVLAAGPGDRNLDGSLRPMTVKVGDYVMFQGYAGFKVYVNHEQLQVIQEDEVLGIVDERPKFEVVATT